jgi:hypothetical protein
MGKPEAPAGYEAHAAIALISEEHRFLRGQFEALEAELEAGIELALGARSVRPKSLVSSISAFVASGTSMNRSTLTSSNLEIGPNNSPEP